MQISLLEEFVVWADNKTFEAAAKQLHISQSTLSKHLIALETELGVSLINRQGKARLTPAGISFYNGAVDVLGRFNRAVEECKRADKGSGCEIVVWDPYIFSGAMRELSAAMQHYAKASEIPFHFTLRNEPYKTARESLDEGLIDVAIDYVPLESESVVDDGKTLRFPLIVEPVILWCHADHPLARKKPLVPRDLQGVPVMCSMELAHPLEESISAMCARRGFKPQYYRFNPTSQASFFFEAPSRCVYLVTDGLKSDERISSRDDMVVRYFDDEDFAVRSVVLVRGADDNPALKGFCEFLSNNEPRMR